MQLCPGSAKRPPTQTRIHIERAREQERDRERDQEYTHLHARTQRARACMHTFIDLAREHTCAPNHTSSLGTCARLFYVSHHIFIADAVDGTETKSVMCRGITGCGGRVFLLAGYQYQYLPLSAWFAFSFSFLELLFVFRVGAPVGSLALTENM